MCFHVRLTFNLQPYPVLSALDVVHTVIVIDEGRGGIRPIKHPLVCTRLRRKHKIPS